MEILDVKVQYFLCKKLNCLLNLIQNYDKIMIIKMQGGIGMYIRPVSDLRNKYPEIEELVLKEDKAVYLTKNGYGSMVVLSLEKYESMLNEIDM